MNSNVVKSVKRQSLEQSRPTPKTTIEEGLNPVELDRLAEVERHSQLNAECSAKIMEALNPTEEESERVREYKRLVREQELEEINEAIRESTEADLTTKPIDPNTHKRVYNYAKQRWEYKRIIHR